MERFLRWCSPMYAILLLPLVSSAVLTFVSNSWVKWVYKLPLAYPRSVALAYSELEAHLRSMITQRRLDESSGSSHSDLFSALLAGVGSDEDEKEPVLTTEELLGNMYIFLLAGHGSSLFFSLSYVDFGS